MEETKQKDGGNKTDNGGNKTEEKRERNRIMEGTKQKKGGH